MNRKSRPTYTQSKFKKSKSQIKNQFFAEESRTFAPPLITAPARPVCGTTEVLVSPCNSPVAPLGSIRPSIAPYGGSSHVLRGVGGSGSHDRARIPPRSEASELIIVENFFEELKAKVGN